MKECQVREQGVVEALYKNADQIRAAITPKPAGEDPVAILRDRLYRAIEYSIKRHDWYEEQRYRILQTLLAVSTFATTLGALTIKSSNTVQAPLLWTLMSGALIIVIALVRGLHFYNIELDADRPYRRISDIRFWFFKYNLPPERPTEGADVAAERKRFLERLAENFQPPAALREDIEQLFILHVLHRYKSDSLKLLRWLLTYTLIGLFLQLVAIFLSTL